MRNPVMQLILFFTLMVISMGYCGSRKDDFSQWRKTGQAGERSSRPSKLRSSIGQQQVVSNCECGRANSLWQTRIVGGTETQPHRYPFIAFAREKKVTMIFAFSATILTIWHLLAVGHITYGVSAENITAFVGVHNVSNLDGPSVQKLSIASNIPYPNYNNETLYLSDISILVTTEIINFTPNVGPACLTSRFFSLEGQQLKVMGWGDTKGTGNRDVLREVDLNFVPYDECKKSWDVLDLSQICTFGDGKNICNGDSGGGVFYYNPVDQRYTQVGIISFTAMDCVSAPSVSTDVRVYYTWISRTIAETKSEVTACLGA